MPPRPRPTAYLSLYTGSIFPLFTFAMSKLKVFVPKSMTALTMFKVENQSQVKKNREFYTFHDFIILFKPQ